MQIDANYILQKNRYRRLHRHCATHRIHSQACEKAERTSTDPLIVQLTLKLNSQVPSLSLELRPQFNHVCALALARLANVDLHDCVLAVA